MLDVRLVDALAGATQEEGHTGFLHLSSAMLASTFIAKRVVDREVEFVWCTQEINVLHLLGIQYTPPLMCVCVCVFFPPFILDVKFVGCTSRGHTGGRSHRISHPPSFCDACLYFSREKDQRFLSLVDLEVEFCVLTI